MGLLDHKELSIIKGVGITPGDTSSAEQPLTVLSLLDESGGISLTEDGWTPNIPSLKGGGVWADSPISDGRALISAQNANVVETMRVLVSAGSNPLYAAKFARFQRLIQDCRAYHDSQWQIEPVYLKWWAADAPGPQYARIFNIDIDVDWQDSSLSEAVITLTVEREYGWLGVRPGGNPKEWTYSPASKNLGQFNAGNAALATGSDHLVSETITNKLEFNTTTTFLTKNHIDIDADEIPGDLPALICLTGKPTVSGNAVLNLFISKSTKPRTFLHRITGVEYPQYNALAAAAATVGTDTSLATDTDGIVYNPVSANARRARISFATDATLTPQRLSWSASNLFQNANALRGRYILFLRARQNAGAAGNTIIQVKMTEGANGERQIGANITPIVAADVQLHYIGVVAFPTADRSFSGIDGKGLYVAGAGAYGAGIDFVLYASRSTGVATLDIFDIVMMPIDEGAVRILPASGMSSSDMRTVYDNTGYFRHGGLGGYADVRNVSLANLDNIDIAEIQGDDITLTPKVNNRLYFLLQSPATNNAPPLATMEIRLNIVPRWSGIRDV